MNCRPSLLSLLLAVGCSAPLPEPSFKTQASVEQLYVTHAKPGATIELLDGGGKVVRSGAADAQGSLVFRKLLPGAGYVVRSGPPPLAETSRPLTVLSVDSSRPEASFYQSQKVGPGFTYLKTRDGTLLSAYVTLPGPVDKGPYPTVIDYSGYSPSKPPKPDARFAWICDTVPAVCDRPDDPAATFAAIMGYATVSVNMRGTGCSGGAYDYFELLQTLDGYDVVETVAAQSWVKGHKVGMVGISYPGISQLFVAQLNPPSLAAISPLSVFGNAVTTLLPGGILNNGFAIQWVEHVLDRAAPYGQGWEKRRVEGGDTICAENQLLHSQRVDNVDQAYKTPYYLPEIADPLNPVLFVDKIKVPVFFASAFQDEQTGPFFFALLDRFKAAPVARFTVYNGVHADAFAPQVLAEWKYFLDLFVAEQPPTVEPLLRDFAPVLFNEIFGSGLRFPPERFPGLSHAQALAAYRAEPPLRVIFENGAGKADEPGAPVGRFERSFARWPAPEVKPYRLYLQGDGSLGEKVPAEAGGASSFLHDPAAGQRVILPGGGDPWERAPKWRWPALVAGKALAFVTPPAERDRLFFGTASADLWVRSTVDDADLEVTLSEVRPDGQEMLLQTGWLRASQRALGLESTELWPSPTQRVEDLRALQPGEWIQVRIAIPSFSHHLRAGSRLRLSVDTPGDSRASWRFLLKKYPGPAEHTVGHSTLRPSSIALPLLDGIVPPAGPLPACPSLRGQPCRSYLAHTNTPAP